VALRIAIKLGGDHKRSMRAGWRGVFLQAVGRMWCGRQEATEEKLFGDFFHVTRSI